MNTIKICHASDLHCSERNRLDDWIKLHATLAEQVRERAVDLVLLAGDLFHAKSTPAERNAMAGFLLHLAEHCPVVIVKGNHDAAGDLDIFATLACRNSITVMDRPGTEVIEVHSADSGQIAVYAIPWFDRAHLVAELPSTTDAETTRNLTIEAARQLLVVARAHVQQARDTGYLPILAGHLMVAGSETSTGQTLIGTTVELAPGDLADVGAEYVALGHIHKPQSWADDRIAYAGSTWAQNFGEDHPHGWRLVSFEDGRFVGAEFVELPARRIVLFEGEFDANGKLISENIAPTLPGDLVRFRYRIPAEALHLVDETRMLQMFEGASEVKLEAVIVQEQRIRSEAIITARSSWEKVEAYLAAKGIEADADTRARIRAKLEAIEVRTREAVATCA